MSSAERDQSTYRSIPTAVSELRSQARARLVHEGIASALAATAATSFAAVAFFALAPPLWWLRVSTLAAWLVAVAAAIAWRLRGPLGQIKAAQDVAQLVERRFPGLRNDVTASLQFVEELSTLREGGPVSAALVERLLSQTEGRLGELRPKLPEALPQAWLKVPYGVVAASFVAALLMSLVAPDAFRQGVRGLLFGPPEAVADASTRQAPIVADIRLTYRYPDYTGLGQRTIQNATGDVEVLRGTVVEFSGVALRAVSRAEIVITPDAVANSEAGAEAERDAKPGESGAEEPPSGQEASEGEAPSGVQRILLQRRPGGKLVAQFSALESGTYTIEAELEDGEPIRDGITRTIRVIEDEAPRITITSPQGEVDVSPEDVVTFAYEASDDFGLMELALVTSFGGDSEDRKRVVIKEMGAQQAVVPGDARPTEEEGQKLQFSGEHLLDLVPYDLQPKDRLVVMLEAVDNDTTEGPKVATSAPVILKVSSAEDKHLEIVEDEEEIFEALLDVLGDYLEKPIGDTYTSPQGKRVEGVSPQWSAQQLTERFEIAQPPHKKKLEILRRMKALMERMTQDPLMLKRDYELFSNTHTDLAELHSLEKVVIERTAAASRASQLTAQKLQTLFEARQGTIRGTEKAIITLEDLIASQRMDSAMDTAKDLKEAVERLKELMKKYQETGDEALKAEIMREMQRLRARMRELMEKMQAQIKKLPQEHVNMEAMDREGMSNKANDAANSMEEMMKALENGDLDKALSMLDQMSQSVDDMLGQMQEEFDEMQPEGLSELDKKVSEVMDELNNLQAQEQQLAKETNEINKEMAAEQREKLQEMMEQFAQDQLDKVKEMREQLDKMDPGKLDPIDRSSVKRMQNNADRLQRALEQKDMAEALDQARELAREMDAAERNMRSRARFMPPSDPRRRDYQDAQQGVRRNKPTADEIARSLEQMMEQAQPQPNGEQAGKLQQMAERQQQIRDRAGELREQLEGDEQFPMLGEKMGPGLQEAEQYMEGAKESLGQREGKRAHESEKLAMERLQGLKDDLKQTLKEERMGQQQRGRRLSQEKVEIPDADRRAPREFREDIMEAMKEGGIETYESELQQYYESLVR